MGKAGINIQKIKINITTLSIGITLLLGVLKVLAYLYVSSNAILGDAIHSFTDSISSALVLVGIIISAKRSEKFPYGLYKVENIVSVVLSFLIMGAGVEVAYRAFAEESRLKHIGLGLALIALTIFASLLLGLLKIKVAKRTGSPSIEADGYHSLSDALSSAVVFLGLALNGIFPYSDRIAGVIVGIILLYAGGEIFIQSLMVLLDASLPEDDINKIMTVLHKYKDIHVNWIRGRRSGSHYFVEVSLKLREKTLKKAHEFVDRIEMEIEAVLPDIEKVVIHYEPYSKKGKFIAIPIIAGKPTAHIGKSEGFLVIIKNQDISAECIWVENPGQSLKHGRGTAALKTLIEEDVDVVLLPEEMKTPGMRTLLNEFFELRIEPGEIQQYLSLCREKLTEQFS